MISLFYMVKILLNGSQMVGIEEDELLGRLEQEQFHENAVKE